VLLAQCFTVSDYYVRFGIVRFQGARCGQWYETRGIVDTHDTCAVLRYFFTATIYRGIS